MPDLMQILELFQSYYIPPAIGILVLVSLAITLAFGAIWMAGFLPPMFKNWKLWIVAVASYIIPTIVIAFINYPLRTIISEQLGGALNSYFVPVAAGLMTGAVIAIMSGLVITGALLIPSLIYRDNWKSEFNPRFALMLGALSGTVYGMMQAFILQNQLFVIGIDAIYEAHGISVILPFIERFFAVAFYAGIIAIAAYGFAIEKGWKFYLVAAAICAVYSYSTLLIAADVLGAIAAEIIISLIAIGAIGTALWLYWKKTNKSEK